MAAVPLGYLVGRAATGICKPAPAYKLLPATASAHTTSLTPVSSADQLLPSHFAMWLAGPRPRIRNCRRHTGVAQYRQCEHPVIHPRSQGDQLPWLHLAIPQAGVALAFVKPPPT